MKKYRLYYDKEKEITWLNQMCDRGYAMTSFKLGLYDFEKCEPGEYRYQIDMLPEQGADAERFKEFMQESDVEVVDTWVAWVYLRRKESAGDFVLYSDPMDVVQQYRRIQKFFALFFVIELAIGSLNILISIANSSYSNRWAGLLCVAVSLIFGVMVHRCQKKIKEYLQKL